LHRAQPRRYARDQVEHLQIAVLPIRQRSAELVDEVDGGFVQALIANAMNDDNMLVVVSHFNSSTNR
jgi:hypothetical protein